MDKEQGKAPELMMDSEGRMATKEDFQAGKIALASIPVTAAAGGIAMAAATGASVGAFVGGAVAATVFVAPLVVAGIAGAGPVLIRKWDALGEDKMAGIRQSLAEGLDMGKLHGRRAALASQAPVQGPKPGAH